MQTNQLDTLAIDPGTDLSGAAWGAQGRLYYCDHVQTPKHGYGVTSHLKLVIEVPNIQDGFTRDPASVLKCRDAATQWRMMCHWRDVVTYAPSQWKGSAKKPTSHRLIWRVLTPAERLVVARSFQMTPDEIHGKIESACIRLHRDGKVTRYSWAGHNVLDAIGVLLKDAGRL